MPKKYPPLTLEEVIAILKANNFTLTATRGSHSQYEAEINGQNRKVTVDKHAAPFDDFLIKSMIRQSGLTREEFYQSNPKTAKKISIKTPKILELINLKARS